MNIAAAYIRVSTDDQVELSPTSQIKLIRDYAKRNDMVVPDDFVFADEGISGKETTKRPAFNAMIGTAKQKPKPFDCILVWKFSRFARNREDSILYKSMLRKQLGIDVISISENIGDDKMSILIEALIEAMDEYYSINLAEEVVRGMTEKASRGGCVSGPALGYNVIDSQYVVNADTAPIVKMIFNDYLNGLGFRDIAIKLNEMCIKTTRGGLFENRTIEYILRNSLYIGKIHWSKNGRVSRDYSNETITVDGLHEPIISKELFEAVQLKIINSKRATPKNSHPTPPEDWMLRGLLRCSNCGAALSKGTKTSVQCHQYAKGRCLISHYAAIDSLNASVIDMLQLALTSGDIDLKKRANNTAEFTEINLIMQKEYEKLDRIKQAFQAGIDTLDEYKVYKEKIETTIRHLKAKLPEQSKVDTKNAQNKDEFISTHLSTLSTLQKLKSNIPETEKNLLLKSIIEKIVFEKKSNSLKLFFCD